MERLDMLAQWNESSSRGIPAIDRLHRELYKMLEDLKQAMAQASETGVVSNVMDRLLPFVHEHFNEEKKLLMHDSVEYQQCCARHAEELAMVNFFLRGKSADDPCAATDLLHFVDSMLDGLLEHDRRKPDHGEEKVIQ